MSCADATRLVICSRHAPADSRRVTCRIDGREPVVRDDDDARACRDAGRRAIDGGLRPTQPSIIPQHVPANRLDLFARIDGVDGTVVGRLADLQRGQDLGDDKPGHRRKPEYNHNGVENPMSHDELQVGG